MHVVPFLLLVWTVTLALLFPLALCDTLGVVGKTDPWPRNSALASSCQAEGIDAGNKGNTAQARSRFLCSVVRSPEGTAGALHFANYGVSLMRMGQYSAAVEASRVESGLR